jgi:hypothetical protein
MAHVGWKRLLEGWPWFRGEGSYPILPNSEFMPPVRLGRKPYGCPDAIAFEDEDPWGWPVDEYEQEVILRPGLASIAAQLIGSLAELCRAGTSALQAESKLVDNPYWPSELARAAPTLNHERFVLLLPLALSLAQDDKARVRWTLYGASEQGPARAFWKGFFTALGREVPEEEALGFFRELLSRAYGEPADRLADLHRAGLRILPQTETREPFGPEGPLPGWASRYRLEDYDRPGDAKYLLTFRPFGELGPAIRKKYLAGKLHLLPFPGSLFFWGVKGYWRLQEKLPFATQIPLLHFLERHSGIRAIRVPQSGWFRETGAAGTRDGRLHGPWRDTYRRTARSSRFHRYEDELVSAHEHHITHVLFSTRQEDIGLYHKPMARNVQLWGDNFELILDGPHADPAQIKRAAEIVAGGGAFGYRIYTPPMRVGPHEVFWHRPLAAFREPSSGRAVMVPHAPPGYLTVYPVGTLISQPEMELWPRLMRRPAHVANLELFHSCDEKPPLTTVANIHKILHVWELAGRSPLTRSFARQLLATDKRKTLAAWLRSLPQTAHDPERGRLLLDELRQCIEPDELSRLPEPLTYHRTARRDFEVEYWNTIASLSCGEFVNKNNADVILDEPTRKKLAHPWRDLEGLGKSLLAYYTRLLAAQKMTRKALVGETPFAWRTQYAFPWMGGWVENQEGRTHERNLMVVIPGKDRSRAVIMADHYDTAYMLDRYDPHYGGTGARLSAAGADDNCSATAALMLGAPVFLELCRQGRLACDIWLVHLTGEEYPAEGQGASRLCEWLVEGTLKLRTGDDVWHDLSGARIQGLYVLDMIAHNNRRDRDVFQIAPGAAPESCWLAYQAHLANAIWNESTAAWNRQPARKKAGRHARTEDGRKVPRLCQYPWLHGEVRPHFDLRSTLFNTDGQAFSDVGVPVVLFMENYDIDRTGYHDSKDTMERIHLDYGSALAAITIETVARAATEPAPPAFARQVKLG